MQDRDRLTHGIFPYEKSDGITETGVKKGGEGLVFI